MEIPTDIIFTVASFVMLAFGIWGVLDFEGFRESYIHYCDKRNPLCIVYPKGAYLTFVLKSMIFMMFFISIVTITLQILSLLGVVTLEYY